MWLITLTNYILNCIILSMGNEDVVNLKSKGVGNFLVDMMMEYAPLAIFVVDEEGKIKGFNSRAREFLNMPPEIWRGEKSVFSVTPFNANHIVSEFEKNRDNHNGVEFRIMVNNEEAVCGVYPLTRILNIPGMYACFVDKLKREGTFGRRGRKVEGITELLLESIGDAVLVAEVDAGVISYGNKKAQELLGYKRDELVGLPMSKLHPESEFERIMFIFERQAKGELDLAEDIPFVRKDGRVIYVDINSTKVNALDRKYVVGILRDITYKKALLSKLLKTNRLLEAIFEKTNLMFAFMSEDFRIVRVNENFASTLGPDVEQFVGRNFFDIFDEPELKALFEEVVLLKRNLTMKEFPFTRPDGKVVYMDFMLSPLSEEADEVKGIIFSGTDVTELVLTRESLHEVEYIKDTVLHELNELVSYMTPEFEIKWANKQFLEYSLYSDFSDLVGKKCYMALEADHKQCDTCPALMTLKDLKPHSSYVKFKSGREFYVRTFPDVRGNELKGIVTACLDITELRRREKRIERLNEMLRVIKDINHVIMREESAESMVEKVMDVFESKRNYTFAAILLTDHLGIPVLSNIKPEDYTDRFNELVSRMSSGDIPQCLEKAFVEDEPVISDPEGCSDCEFFSVCEKGKGILARKLEYKGNVMGILMVCVSKGSLNDNEEIELFKELTDDIAYALYHVKA